MSKSDDKAKGREAELERGGQGGLVKEVVQTVLWALVIAYIVRSFLWEPFNIPSGSMKPTLLVGDYLFVSKYAYGYSKYSFPFGFDLFDGRIFAAEPERGDVAVFKLPTDNETDYIKRIIGLPGDTIQVIAGILHINDKPVKREKVSLEFTKDSTGFPHQITQYVETLPNGLQHDIWERSDSESLDNTPKFHIPDGHYFMMGDNRDHSLDSRATSQVGLVPAENLIGRASVIFFSHDGSAGLFEVWKWPFAIRFGRIANAVE